MVNVCHGKTNIHGYVITYYLCHNNSNNNNNNNNNIIIIIIIFVIIVITTTTSTTTTSISSRSSNGSRSSRSNSSNIIDIIIIMKELLSHRIILHNQLTIHQNAKIIISEYVNYVAPTNWLLDFNIFYDSLFRTILKGRQIYG